MLLLVGMSAAPAWAVPALPEPMVVEGEVVEYAIVAGSWLHIEPPQTLYRLQIVPGAAAGEPQSLLSKTPLPTRLFGQRVRATAICSGDEWGRRCWLEQVEVVD